MTEIQRGRSKVNLPPNHLSATNDEIGMSPELDDQTEFLNLFTNVFAARVPKYLSEMTQPGHEPASIELPDGQEVEASEDIVQIDYVSQTSEFVELALSSPRMVRYVQEGFVTPDETRNFSEFLRIQKARGACPDLFTLLEQEAYQSVKDLVALDEGQEFIARMDSLWAIYEETEGEFGDLSDFEYVNDMADKRISL